MSLKLDKNVERRIVMTHMITRPESTWNTTIITWNYKILFKGKDLLAALRMNDFKIFHD